MDDTGGGPPPPWGGGPMDDGILDGTNITTDATTATAMAQWRERERRQRTVRLLMMFLLMLLLMDGEEQSTRRRKDSLMRKGRNNGVGVGSSKSKKGSSSSSSTGAFLDESLYKARSIQEERLSGFVIQHERYHELMVEKNHDIDVDAEMRTYAMEQDALRTSLAMQTNDQTTTATADGSQTTNHKKKEEEETKGGGDEEDNTVVFHYPWNATGFYRGEWVRVEEDPKQLNQTENLDDEEATTAGDEVVHQQQQHRVPTQVMPPTEMEQHLDDILKSKRRSVAGVQLLPEGYVLKLDNLTKIWEAHTNTPAADEMRRRRRAARQHGLLSFFQVASPELNVVVDNARDEDEEDEDEENDLLLPPPQITLKKNRGRAAFQLFSRAVPAMKELSLVDGFCKLYDSTTVGYSTGRDVLLRVRGVLIHSIGRLSLVSNASPGRSAMIVVGESNNGGARSATSTASVSSSSSSSASSSPVRQLTKGPKQNDDEDDMSTDTTEVDEKTDTTTSTTPMTTTTTTWLYSSETEEESEDEDEIMMMSEERETTTEDRRKLLQEAVSKLDKHATKQQVENVRDAILKLHSHLDVVKDKTVGWEVLVANNDRSGDDDEQDDEMGDGESGGGGWLGLSRMDSKEVDTTTSPGHDDDDDETKKKKQQQQRQLNDLIDSDDEVTDDIVVKPVRNDEAVQGDDNSAFFGNLQMLANTAATNVDRRTLEEKVVKTNNNNNNNKTLSLVAESFAQDEMMMRSNVILPFPFVPDDRMGTIRKHKTPAQRKMPPYEQALEENARRCEFEITMDVRPEEWTRGAWKLLLNRKQYEASQLNPERHEVQNGKNESEDSSSKNKSSSKRKKHSSASKSLSSSGNNDLEKPMQDQAWIMLMTGTIHSPNCGFTSSVNVTAIRTDWEHRTGKAINYSFYMMLTCLTQIVVLLRQLLHTQAQSAATRVSLLCIGWQTVLDALLCLGHIYLSLAMQPLFTAFASVAFFKLLIFCVIEMKYMAIIIQARNSSNGGQTTTEVLRRQVAMLHLRFYVALVCAFLAFFYANTKYRTLYVLVLYSFWVPQIVQNIITEAKHPLHNYYIYGMSFTRCIAPLYIFAVPNNFLYPDAPTNYVLVQLLFLWVGIQTAILMAQSKYGARFMIPARFLPPKFDYSRPIPPSLLPPEVLRDAQALQERQEKQEEQQDQQQQLKKQQQQQCSLATTTTSSDHHDGTIISNRPSTTTIIVSSSNSKRGGGATRNRRQRKNAEHIQNKKTSLMIADDPENIPKRATMLDCVICCNGIDVLNRSAYMLAPCDHIFHRDCLVQWMDVKMECPVCRKELPTL